MKDKQLARKSNMKAPFVTVSKPLVLIAVLILLAGCARKLQFKVVDAASGRPVDGGEVQWFKYFEWMKIYKTNLIVVGYTDKGGVIEIDGIKNGNLHGNTFIFTKQEYQGASVVVHSFTNTVAILSPDRPSVPNSEEVHKSIAGRDAEVTVPLHAR